MSAGRIRSRGPLSALLVMAAASTVGCVQLDRLSAVPAAETQQASVMGVANARYVLDDKPPAAMIAEFKRAYDREVAYQRRHGRGGPLPPAIYLAVSGGGDNGAFGAGLLVGWTERGNRPNFKAVTGISTGALTAPFAFLGPEYDPALTEVYTAIDANDVLAKRSMLAAVTDDAMADSRPLLAMISKYLNDEMVAKIAREYEKGRLLMVATTNLDAAKPVIWNIGAIASSGNPQSTELIRRILLASASIPGVFPPVMFDVDINGTAYQEMHGDGGAVAQTFLYPPTIAVVGFSPEIRARGRTAYLIRNGKLFEDWKQVERKTLSVAGRAVSTLIASNGVGDMYRIYSTTRRDRVGYNLAFIESDFTEPYKDPFDRDYMNALFNYAKAKGRAGYPWRKAPPGLSTPEAVSARTATLRQ